VRRRTRLSLLPVALVTTLVALAGCGGSNSSSASSGGSTPLDAVTISGDVGTAPEVTWNSKMTVSDVQNTTLTKGDGDTVAKGDMVSAQIWVGNGYTQKTAYSTYDQGGAQSVTVDDTLSPVLADAMTGATVGSRIAVTAPADKLFGPSGNAQLNIGNKDPVLVIIDIVSKPKPPLKGPEGKAQPSPAWAPKIVEKGTTVTSLDFAGTPKPDGKLQGEEALRRELQQAAGQLRHRDRRGDLRLGQDARRPEGGQPRDPRDPAQGGLRQEGPADRGHQGHRHAVLRGRHPRRLLSTMGAMSSRSPR
jgi:peptidylprolyl isomerase